MSTQYTFHCRRSHYRQQRGAALVVGLLLLVVLTLLAISGMNTASLDLQMAGNEQSYQNSFQAAETGVEQALSSGSYNTGAPSVIPVTTVPGTTDTYQATTQFNCGNGISPVRGYSMAVGDSSYVAYHFDTTSIGTSSRNASSTHVQSFYVVGPASSC